MSTYLKGALAGTLGAKNAGNTGYTGCWAPAASAASVSSRIRINLRSLCEWRWAPVSSTGLLCFDALCFALSRKVLLTVTTPQPLLGPSDPDPATRPAPGPPSILRLDGIAHQQGIIRRARSPTWLKQKEP